jgi:hypothetical protein
MVTKVNGCAKERETAMRQKREVKVNSIVGGKGPR